MLNLIRSLLICRSMRGSRYSWRSFDRYGWLPAALRLSVDAESVDLLWHLRQRNYWVD